MKIKAHIGDLGIILLFVLLFLVIGEVELTSAKLMDNITNWNDSDFTNAVMDGRPAEAVLGTYYNLISIWFIVIMMMLPYVLLLIKTRSLALASIVTIFISYGAEQVLPPEFLRVIYFMFVLSVGSLIAALFLGRGD